jgi:hypothetical protein
VTESRIVEITDTDSFGLVPPCADARFDHRTCDYWEDADRGSKSSRPSMLEVKAPVVNRSTTLDNNPFAPPRREVPPNPFALPQQSTAADPAFPSDLFAEDDLFAPPAHNPFAPTEVRERPLREGVPRKLALLDRGRGVFGSYAKVLVVDGEPVAYCQFGPLSAYPRATRLRDLYPQLPDSPLPAVISCIASTSEARRAGHARTLVENVCDDLAARGFAAVEAYPDLTRPDDETSGARPEFWHKLGFETAVDDERFPVMRREL